MTNKLKLLFLVITAFLPLAAYGQSIQDCKETHERYTNLERLAIKKVAASYPNERSVKVWGRVIVKVEINKRGDVVSARAICGHPLLLAGAVSAAKDWKFIPKKVKGRAVKTTGVIMFDFPDRDNLTGIE
jgi:TonB family protein